MIGPPATGLLASLRLVCQIRFRYRVCSISERPRDNYRPGGFFFRSTFISSQTFLVSYWISLFCYYLRWGIFNLRLFLWSAGTNSLNSIYSFFVFRKIQFIIQYIPRIPYYSIWNNADNYVEKTLFIFLEN